MAIFFGTQKNKGNKMSVRITMLAKVAEMEGKPKKRVTVSQIQEYIGASNPDFSAKLWALAHEGFLKKTTIGTKNAYTTTPKGLKFLSENTDAIISIEDLQANYQKVRSKSKEKSGPKKQNSNVRLSNEALGAINSITAIIEKNDRLTNFLRSMQSQISVLLADMDQLDGATEAEGDQDE